MWVGKATLGDGLMGEALVSIPYVAVTTKRSVAGPWYELMVRTTCRVFAHGDHLSQPHLS